MPAEIESMMWYGDRPWHGLGTEVLEMQTSEEALVKAALNWEVEKKKLFISGNEDDSGPFLEVEGNFAIVRKTDGKALGVVGSRYVPFQNRDAFKWFDDLVGSREAIYETAGSLRGGKIIWIMSKLPNHLGWSDDPIEQWLVLSNSHDGSRQVSVMATPIRVVCMNTLNAGIHRASAFFEMRHTSRISEMQTIIDAREVLGTVTRYFEELDGVLRLLKSYSMSEQETQRYIYNLFPIKTNRPTPDAEDEAQDVELGVNAQKYVNKILELMETGKGSDIPGVRGSAYGVFNAVTEFVDHWQPVKGKAEKMSNKLFSIWFGNGRAFKQRAFNQLVDLVA
jgi:phage/plasmid-like protein (TIGR03299 family)